MAIILALKNWGRRIAMNFIPVWVTQCVPGQRDLKNEIICQNKAEQKVKQIK